MNRKELAERIYDTAYITGEFLLRSGQTSNEYFDIFSSEADPITLKAIAHHMVALVPDNTDILAGLETGGSPIAIMLSQITLRPVRFVRKKAKDYGTCNLVEGGSVAGRGFTVIEDVVTSGGQIIKSVHELRKMGAFVTDALCVIDRESGGVQNLERIGIKLHALFTISELRGGSLRRLVPISRLQTPSLYKSGKSIYVLCLQKENKND